MPQTFSVIIATRDRPDGATARVAELRSMVGAPDQIVLIDDGSSSETAHVLRSLAGPDVVVVRTEGVGPASARNRGVEVAIGDWLLFLDDDDIPAPTWIGAFRQLAADHPDARYLSVGSVTRQGTADSPFPQRDLGPAFSGLHGTYRPGTFGIRRVDFEAIGGFHEDLRWGEFTEMTLRLADGVEAVPARSVAVGGEHLAYIARDPSERGAVRPEILAPSAAMVIASVGNLLARDPQFFANNLAVLAVAEARIGQTRDAKRHLWQAFRVAPWPPRHGIRFLAASIGPVRRRIWGISRAVERAGRPVR